MCMASEVKCACGARTASFHFRDSIMPDQVIAGLYCPACSSAVPIDPAAMIADNGWIIKYDMDVARFMGQRFPAARITPEFLFDEGYCTWNGMYPGDNLDSVRERNELNALAKTNPVEYLKRLKQWAEERMERLKRQGWRKANLPVAA